MPALRTAVALLLCHTAACFLGARPALKLRVARAESDDGDDTDDGDESVIGLDSLPEELQSQIVEAIARSRLDTGAKGVVSTNDDGETISFMFGNEDEAGLEKDEDDDESPFVVLGERKKKKKKKKKQEDLKKSEALERIARFDLRPREVREHLDRYVVRQADAKKVLSVAICDHYNVVRRCLGDENERKAEYSKPNILLLGPSGSGKTYIMRTLAKLLGVPFVRADATKFTETGIVGEDAEDLVRQLVEQADGDVELAQYGIIYIDEVDKLCRGEQGSASGGSQGVPGNRGVQSTFLKVMEETEISLQKSQGMIPQIFLGGEPSQPQRISTKHVLFIFSGAFTGLDERLKQKCVPKNMGFLGEETEAAESDIPVSYLKQATSADFVDAGLETEFIGRIPVRVAVDPLGTRDLELVLLQSEGSVLRQYECDFEGYGVALTVGREAVSKIAEQAAAEKTGARGLVTVLERTFREFKYELPCAGVSALHCDAATVEDPGATLARLLEGVNGARESVRRADAARVEAEFFAQHALNVTLAPSLTEFLLAEARAHPERSVRGLCAPLLDESGLAAALRTIEKRTGTLPELPLELLLDREATVTRWLGELPEAAEDEDDEDDDSEEPVASASSDESVDEPLTDALREFLDAAVK